MPTINQSSSVTNVNSHGRAITPRVRLSQNASVADNNNRAKRENSNRSISVASVSSPKSTNSSVRTQTPTPSGSRAPSGLRYTRSAYNFGGSTSKPSSNSKSIKSRPSMHDLQRKDTGVRSRTSSTISGNGNERQHSSKQAASNVMARRLALQAVGGSKVDVHVRCRPLNARETAAKESIVVNLNERTGDVRVTNDFEQTETWRFDKAFGPSTSQENLYQQALKPVLSDVLEGISCAVFAYGQTGAGKTFTMRGDLSNSANDANAGLIQRITSDLFEMLPERYVEYSVSISFLEVYMERLDDLLRPGTPTSTTSNGGGGMTRTFSSMSMKESVSSNNNNRELRLIDIDGKTQCHGLTEIPVENVTQVMKLLREAEKKCAFAETHMNKFSNRAHRIFTLNIRGHGQSGVVNEMGLRLVDLAGSEDIKRSGATGLTAREAQLINRSLLTLGRVINGLASDDPHIPYRDSKLTRLLSEALGGECKTTFIACIAPSAQCRTETLSTLRYAQNAMDALNITQMPRWRQDELVIEGLTQRVRELETSQRKTRKLHLREIEALEADKDALKVELSTTNEKLEEAKQYGAMMKQKYNTAVSTIRALLVGKNKLRKQKHQLIDELLTTRGQRDGFRRDRQQVMSILTASRRLRTLLLQAHSNTESKLHEQGHILCNRIDALIKERQNLHEDLKSRHELNSLNADLTDSLGSDVNDKMSHVREGILQFEESMNVQCNDLTNTIRSATEIHTNQLCNIMEQLTNTVESTKSATQSLEMKLTEMQKTQNQSTKSIHESIRNHHETYILVKVQELLQSVSTQMNLISEESKKAEKESQDNADMLNQQIDQLHDITSIFTNSLRADLVATIADIEKVAVESARASTAQQQQMERLLHQKQDQLSHAASEITEAVTSALKKSLDQTLSQQSDATTKLVAEMKTTKDARENNVQQSITASSNKLRTSHDAVNHFMESATSESDGQHSTVYKSSNNATEYFAALRRNTDASRHSVQSSTSKLIETNQSHVVRCENAFTSLKTQLDNDTQSIIQSMQESTTLMHKNLNDAKQDIDTQVTHANTTQSSIVESTNDMASKNKLYTEQEMQQMDLIHTKVKEFVRDLYRDTTPIPYIQTIAKHPKLAKTDAYEKIVQKFSIKDPHLINKIRRGSSGIVDGGGALILDGAILVGQFEHDSQNSSPLSIAILKHEKGLENGESIPGEGYDYIGKPMIPPDSTGLDTYESDEELSRRETDLLQHLKIEQNNNESPVPPPIPSPLRSSSGVSTKTKSLTPTGRKLDTMSKPDTRRVKNKNVPNKTYDKLLDTMDDVEDAMDDEIDETMSQEEYQENTQENQQERDETRNITTTTSIDQENIQENQQERGKITNTGANTSIDQENIQENQDRDAHVWYDQTMDQEMEETESDGETIFDADQAIEHSFVPENSEFEDDIPSIHTRQKSKSSSMNSLTESSTHPATTPTRTATTTTTNMSNYVVNDSFLESIPGPISSSVVQNILE